MGNIKAITQFTFHIQVEILLPLYCPQCTESCALYIVASDSNRKSICITNDKLSTIHYTAKVYYYVLLVKQKKNTLCGDHVHLSVTYYQ